MVLLLYKNDKDKEQRTNDKKIAKDLVLPPVERHGNLKSSDQGYGVDMPQEKIFDTGKELFIRGEIELGAVTTDDEITWLKENFSNVHYARINGVGHLLHLEDRGQAPVMRVMKAFLERTPK